MESKREKFKVWGVPKNFETILRIVSHSTVQTCFIAGILLYSWNFTLQPEFHYSLNPITVQVSSGLQQESLLLRNILSGGILPLFHVPAYPDRNA